MNECTFWHVETVMKKVTVVLGHSKQPLRRGKRSLRSNGTGLTVSLVHVLGLHYNQSQRPWSKDTLASGMGLKPQLTRLSTWCTTLTVRVKDLLGDDRLVP